MKLRMASEKFSSASEVEVNEVSYRHLKNLCKQTEYVVSRLPIT